MATLFLTAPPDLHTATDRAAPAPAAAAASAAPPAVDVSVILPVMNERDNLRPLLAQIHAALAGGPWAYEVVAVDDGSTDGSAPLLAELAAADPLLRVVRFRRNYGQAAAFDAGFRHAAGRILVTLDADLQNDPADIPRLVAMIDGGAYDFVTGRRAARKDRWLSRKVPSLLANFIIRRVTRTRVSDLGCSLKAYRRELVQDLRLYGEMHRFLAVLIEGQGARVGEVDVNHRPRVAGKSKYGIARTFKVLLDLVTVWFMRGFQTKPIYAFGGIALLLMGGAALSSAYVLYEKFFRGVYVHRNPLFALSMVMAVMAVQFLALGLIAEMTIRTYFESRDRPPYLIASTMGFGRADPTGPAAAAPARG